ncbi:unnamed protein product [Trichobilharzia szidati]|nr:unnamed protein product [Trichobilharzia szidati]
MSAYGSIIEGIGNEILFVFSCMGTVVFLVVAWMSTRVNWELVPVRITLSRQQNENQGTEAETTNVTEPNTADATNSIYSETSSSSSEDELDIECSVRKRSHERVSNSAVQNNSSSDDESKDNKTEEQSKTTHRSKGHLVVKLQYLNDETRFVHVSPTMSVSRFRKKHFVDELVNQNKNVRLIFQGRELLDAVPDESRPNNVRKKRRRLCDYGITDGSTIHCLVTTSVLSSNVNRSSSANDPENSGRNTGFPASDSMLTEFDMGTRLMKPLFAFLLLFTWFFRIAYRQYFNSVSTFALVALTVFFCGAVFTVSLVNAASTFASLFGISLADNNVSNRQSDDDANNANHPSHQDDVQVVTVTMIARRIPSEASANQVNNSALSFNETADDSDNNNPVVINEATSELQTSPD